MTRFAKTRIADALAPLVLAGLSLAFFWKITLTDQVLTGVDLFSYFYPYRDFVSEALRSGHVPLWNPYLFMGAPLLANSQAAALYPLHWPLLWLSAPKQVAWSIALHVWLAGVGTYLLARRTIRLGPAAALVAAITFALGGFIGAQVEHINQLNATAWLPWLLLCLEAAMHSVRWRWAALLAGAGVVSLALLAGHTQAAYIAIVGGAVYALARGLCEPRTPARGFSRLRPARGLAALAAMVAASVALSAAQLLPTLELTRLSVRSGGLSYAEAASFSLKPQLLLKALLPPYFWDPHFQLFSEYVAYAGVIGLVLAGVGAWASLKRGSRGSRTPADRSLPPALDARDTDQLHSSAKGAQGAGRRFGLPALVLALLGLFLAFGAYNPIYYVLYKAVPGLALFRAPARWLLLYAFGTALLAGIGIQVLVRRRALRVSIGALLLVELFVAGGRLAYSRPTAPAAFESMRTATAHLLADRENEPFRFLSLSDILYDPGDLADLQAIFRAYLPEPAIYDLIVATKMKEVLAYNLPLHYRLFSVDGYDGGLLPTARYAALERLFLEPDLIWPDGRLRQQLRKIPSARLLSLLNVRYVIADKLQDVWLDGVYYDLEHSVPLGEVVLTDMPAFEATQLGVVSYLTGTLDLADGLPVAQVVVGASTGAVVTATLEVGRDTGVGLPSTSHEPGGVAGGARVAHHWKDNPNGNDYVALIDLKGTVRPRRILIRSLVPGTGREQVVLRGLTLIDARTGTSRSLSVDPAFRLVHSGDVKIYENVGSLPRAFLVFRSRQISGDDEGIRLLRDAAFDASSEVLLADGPELAGPDGWSAVRITQYSAELVRLRVSCSRPAYLVLTDAYYPGWTAEVDDKSAPIYRADLYFRAISLPPGDHEVLFRFKPAVYRTGAIVSVAAGAAWALALAAFAVRVGRDRRSGI